MILPTVLTVSGFRFFFYNGDKNEPIYIHITKGSATGKIWSEPDILIAYMVGFNNKDIRYFIKVVINKNESFKLKWDEYYA